MIFLQTTTQFAMQDFFTPGSFATLLGSTAVVYIVCGVVQSVFNFSPKWFALLISIAVSFFALAIAKPAEGDESHKAVKYVIAILNGFLIYSSASGSNQVLNNQKTANGRAPANPPAGATAAGAAPRGSAPAFKTSRTFRTNWWE